MTSIAAFEILQSRKTKWCVFLLLFVTFAPLFARAAGFTFPQNKARQVEDESEEILTHIRQLGVLDLAKSEREKVIHWLVFVRERAISKLYEALGNPNPLVRSGVLEVFARMYVEEVWSKLLEFFKKEKDPKIKIAYIKCLAKFGVQELAVVEEFIKNLRKEKNEGVLIELISGLRFAAQEKNTNLTPLPEDYSERLQIIAGTAFLEKWRHPDTTEFVKHYLIKALGELKEIGTLSDLASLVLDPMEVGDDGLFSKKVAMKALETIGTPESMRILIHSLDFPDVNEFAVELLPSFGVRALDDLIRVVKDTDKSPLARGGAADAIGGMRMFDFGKGLQKYDNIKKVLDTLEAAQKDPDVAKKASEALARLNEKGVKRAWIISSFEPIPSFAAIFYPDFKNALLLSLKIIFQ